MRNTHVIATTHYRRPEYSQRLFDALAACHGIERYTVLVHVDRSDRHAADCDQALEIARAFRARRLCETRLYVDGPRLGIDLAKLEILPRAFSLSDYVVFLEDDTIPAPDALQWFEWAGEHIRDSETIASVTGYNRVTDRTAAEIAPYTYGVRTGFCPWGWAMWCTWYERFYGEDGREYREATGRNANGLFDRWIHEKGHGSIYPALARVQSVGGENGEHTPSPRWHRENEFNEEWAGSPVLDLPFMAAPSWTAQPEPEPEA